MPGADSKKPFPPEGLEGGCTCRHVRYRLTSKPLFVHACHCTWCQRETGSAFVMNALIETERVELICGEVDIVDTPSKSGKGQKIARCPKCRIALWSHYPMAGKALRFVRVGTSDDPTLMPPDIHIFTSTKQPWVILPDGLPAVFGYYKPEKMWPQESLDRKAALQKKK